MSCRKRINNKRKIIIVIASIFFIVSVSLASYLSLLGVPHKAVGLVKNSNKENGSSSKTSLNDKSIFLKPSAETQEEIKNWVDEDIEEGKRFKNYEYIVNQYYGIHIGIIDVMLSEINNVQNANDARNVINDLSSYSGEFNGTIAQLKASEKQGIIPPKFIINEVLQEIRNIVSKSPEESVIYSAFQQKLKEQTGINDKDREMLLYSMKSVIKDKMYPGYNKLFDFFKALEPKSDNTAGVWKFKNGDEYYAYILRHNLGENMTPDEVYNLGIEEIANVEKEISKEVRKTGYKGKDINEFMKKLNSDKSFEYPMNAEGKAQILKDYGSIIDDMEKHLHEMFDVLPKEQLELRPVLGFTAETAPQAYYYPSVPGENDEGIFYVNLEKPTYKYDMQSIAYHEAVPGHHLQNSLQQELLGSDSDETSTDTMTAYVEGWGLYAEELADEYGFYKDPYSRLGYLRGELLRDVRLVVDTGIHSRKWSRDYAIQYMKSFECIPDEFVPSEVDRYIVTPGQACSYKVGELKILELRNRAKTELGSRFNLKEFHDVILRNGPMPLEIMDKEVEKYINGKKNSKQLK